jgi:hypothetical protein
LSRTVRSRSPPGVPERVVDELKAVRDVDRGDAGRCATSAARFAKAGDRVVVL